MGELIKYANIPSDGGFHRALFDSEMTTKLWLVMLDEMKSRYSLATIPFQLVQKLTKTPKKSVDNFLRRYAN
ncbi:exonuclease [Moritella sp. PE36]|nr:exonuclease [Moritella sp. PE36]